MKLSPHFSLRELTKSQTAARLGIANQPSSRDVQALRHLCTTILEPVRVQFRVPILPSSGYRCLPLNAAIGGAPSSQHFQGASVDFEIACVNHPDLAHPIEANLVSDQLILEYPQPDKGDGGWLHVSYKAEGNRAECLTRLHDDYNFGLPHVRERC